MITKVTVGEKKRFIDNFLKTYIPRVREASWMLTYMSSSVEHLKKVHFIEDENVQFCPRSLWISTKCIKGGSGIRYIDLERGIDTTDPEKIYNQVRFNKVEDLYIYLNFSDKNTDIDYLGILEENEFIPENLTFQKEAEKVLEKALIKSELLKLEEKINVTLENDDRKTFTTLANKYANLMKEYKEG